MDLIDSQNAKQTETYSQIFEFPAITKISMTRNVTLLGLLDSWHQELEFCPQMDIFGPLEPEL